MRFWNKAASKEGGASGHHLKDVHAPDPVLAPGKLPMRPESGGGGESQARRQAAQGFVFIALVLIVGFYGTRIWLSSTEAARRRVCRQNLHVLGLGLQMYVQDYDGCYPAAESDLGRQLFSYMPDIRALTCPSDDLSRPNPRGRRRERTRVRMSYTYWPPGGRSFDMRMDISDTPVLWDYNGGIPSSPHRKGGNVLYLDGHTRWKPLIYWGAANRPW